MKAKLFFLLLFLTIPFYVYAQASKSEASIEKLKTPKQTNSPNDSNKTNKSSNPTQQTPYVRPGSKERFNRYAKSIVGPAALAKSVVSAGYSTWRNSPEEWGKQWEGFGRRLVSNMGKRTIGNTTSYALEETFKLDSRFYRSQNKKFGARLRNALISPVTARNENGKRVFGFPRIVGTYTSNIIAAETWYPSRYSYKNGLRSGTISLGTNALVNVVKEFILK